MAVRCSCHTRWHPSPWSTWASARFKITSWSLGKRPVSRASINAARVASAIIDAGARSATAVRKAAVVSFIGSVVRVGFEQTLDNNQGDENQGEERLGDSFSDGGFHYGAQPVIKRFPCQACV